MCFPHYTGQQLAPGELIKKMTSRTRYRKNLWQKILDSGQAMEQAANENDWHSLNQLIETRLGLLRDFFAEPVADLHHQTLHQIQAEIRLILEQADSTRNLSQANKEVVARSLKKLRHGKQAIKNYQQSP